MKAVTSPRSISSTNVFLQLNWTSIIVARYAEPVFHDFRMDTSLIQLSTLASMRLRFAKATSEASDGLIKIKLRSVGTSG